VGSNLSEKAIRDFLRAIERGDVTLRPEVDPQEVYAGTVAYQASNGWRIAVFNDANEWDYIEQIVAADGRSVDFADSDELPVLEDYALRRGRVAMLRYPRLRELSLSALSAKAPEWRRLRSTPREVPERSGYRRHLRTRGSLMPLTGRWLQYFLAVVLTLAITPFILLILLTLTVMAELALRGVAL
jgi:hypothetical protein